MGRSPRLSVPGLPHHVTQRGNNKCPIFNFSDDCLEYLNALKMAASATESVIHAYALMGNHVHLLVTPTEDDGLSRMMQSLGIRYVHYMNKRYKRTGTLWEGRFRSSVVETDRYCLECYRYIDLNPVRAGIVNSPIDYIWSSCRANALGERNDLIQPHELYLALGGDSARQAQAYRGLLEDAATETSFRIIRDNNARCLPL